MGRTPVQEHREAHRPKSEYHRFFKVAWIIPITSVLSFCIGIWSLSNFVLVHNSPPFFNIAAGGLDDVHSQASSPASALASKDIRKDLGILPSDTKDEDASSSFGNDVQFTVFETLHGALDTMQNEYFELWLGTWPDTIDWTGAVIGTYLAGMLQTLAIRPGAIGLRTTNRASSDDTHPWSPSRSSENRVNRYFTQNVGYYFGQNDFAIRLQANDDMLWVVLGWLESIKFIHVYSSSQHRVLSPRQPEVSSGKWYGEQFVTAFAHRARIFWLLAQRGWDSILCGGGMLWNNHLLPYKNAITNELYISASIGMYLYFPGDDNQSPFSARNHQTGYPVFPEGLHDPQIEASRGGPYNHIFLSEAKKTYEWLSSSGMVNDAGLYIDGFHIHNYGINGSIGTGECDERNDMVYTYNQGVLLSGLRGLWEATGETTYLEDGHRLARNVMAATGWDAYSEPHIPPPSNVVERWRWHGLGRAGVLEDACDASGDCNQDGQTFKGIFFHHMTLFCEPLPAAPKAPGKTYGADKSLRMLHRQSCKEYATWTAWNAHAALKTRDEHGLFGMWWSLGAVTDHAAASEMLELIEDHSERIPEGATDRVADPALTAACLKGKAHGQKCPDPNERGRGRTVETQGGGVAVLRATWELANLPDDVGP
jgi:hypothetical protein